MNETLLIFALAAGFIIIAAAAYTLYSVIINMGPSLFFKKLWHVTLLPEGILSALFLLLNFRGITASGHFAWWALRTALIIAQLFLLPKLMSAAGKKKSLGVICALLPVLFQVLDNILTELIL